MINISIVNKYPDELPELADIIENAFIGHGAKVNICLFDDRSRFIHSLDLKDFQCDIAFICAQSSELSEYEIIADRYTDVIFAYISDCDMISAAAAANITRSDLGDKIDKVAGRLIFRYIEQNRFIVFKNISGKYTVSYDEIAYIESFGHNIVVHCVDGKDINVTRALGKIEADVSVYGFCRIHSGILVNMKYVYTIRNTEVVVKYGAVEKLLPLSRKKSDYFRVRYAGFLEDRAVTM